MSYPSYSGTPLVAGDRQVLWIKELPKSWQLRPLKYVADINRLSLAEDTNPETEIKYIDIGSVDSEGNIVNFESMVFSEAPSRARRIVSAGDVIISTVRTYLRAIAFCETSQDNLICSTGFAVLSAGTQVVPMFLFYWARASHFVDEVVSRSTGVSYPAINATEIGNLPFPLLPIEQQQRIAAFLDRKTAEIDHIIRLKERQIELLTEKRQALISQAVTRGLDPNVPMKSSGIEWLGDVPAHWVRTKIQHASSSLQTGPFGSQLHSEEYVEDGIPIVNPSNIVAGRIVADSKCTIDDETFQRLKRHVLRAGDIVFGRRGEMGRCALVTALEDGWLCGTGSLRIRLQVAKVWPAYINIQLSLSGLRDWLVLESVGSTMDNLNTEILGSIPIALPPITEQQAIVNYLDRETARLDGVARAVTAQIGKLREWRQGVISAAVTGKIDVRGER